MSQSLVCQHKALRQVKLDGEDGAMIVYQTMSGEVKEFNSAYTYAAVTESVHKWLNGAKIQDAFPYMTPDERELLLTGIGPEEWDDLFADDEDDMTDADLGN